MPRCWTYPRIHLAALRRDHRVSEEDGSAPASVMFMGAADGEEMKVSFEWNFLGDRVIVPPHGR